MKNVTPELISRANDPDANHKIAVKGGQTRTRRSVARMAHGLTLLKPPTEDEIEAELDKKEQASGRRIQYKPMRLHQEQAAAAIAAGATAKQAATYAGVSPRQVRKYMQSGDFRERIVELRQIVMSRIQGQLIGEIGRRVSKKRVAELEPLDLVRFYNLTTGGKDKGLGDSITIVKYDAIFNSITAEIKNSDAEAEVEDFPEYGPEDLLLPGGDSSGD